MSTFCRDGRYEAHRQEFNRKARKEVKELELVLANC